jgi:hypothetical protein
MHTDCPGLRELVARLDASVEAGDAAAVTAAVKADLEDVLSHRRLSLPQGFTVPMAMLAGCCIAIRAAATRLS